MVPRPPAAPPQSAPRAPAPAARPAALHRAFAGEQAQRHGTVPTGPSTVQPRAVTASSISKAIRALSSTTTTTTAQPRRLGSGAMMVPRLGTRVRLWPPRQVLNLPRTGVG